jgi:hypothetical protein
MLPDTSTQNSMFESTRFERGSSHFCGPAMIRITTASSAAGSDSAQRRKKASQAPWAAPEWSKGSTRPFPLRRQVQTSSAAGITSSASAERWRKRSRASTSA